MQQEISLGAEKGKALLRLLWMGLLVYLVWTFLTYLLEGRISLTQHPTVLGRILYVVTANVLIGIVAAVWVVRSAVKAGAVQLGQLGFRALPRTRIAVMLAFVLGFGMFALLNPPSLEPIVVLNIFAQ